jgi:hypothetical protein
MASRAMTDRYLLQLAAIRSLNDELRNRMTGGVVSVCRANKKDFNGIPIVSSASACLSTPL